MGVIGQNYWVQKPVKEFVPKRAFLDTPSKCYDEGMQILDWLATNLTRTMLKRWMIIWSAVVILGVLSLFT
jgi:hypothetical protein